MPFVFEEGFEGFTLGDSPYHPLPDITYITDEEAHSGTKSIKAAVVGDGCVALFTETATYPLTASGWVYLTLAADMPGPKGGVTPDLVFITNDAFFGIGFLDVGGYPGISDCVLLTPDGQILTAPEISSEIPATGWYKFTLSCRDGVTAHGKAEDSVGNVILDASVTVTAQPGIAEATMGYALGAGKVAVLVDIPGYAYWDDIHGNVLEPGWRVGSTNRPRRIRP